MPEKFARRPSETGQRAPGGSNQRFAERFSAEQRDEEHHEECTGRGTNVKEKPSMKETGIERRLQNWAHCQRGKGGGSMSTRETRRVSPYGGQGYQCMTNVVCTLMREAANGPKGGAASQAKLDFEDAATINAAWLQLGTRHKLLLRDFYVLERAVNVICRELSIKHWPASHWHHELRAAQVAVEYVIDNKKG